MAPSRSAARSLSCTFVCVCMVALVAGIRDLQAEIDSDALQMPERRQLQDYSAVPDWLGKRIRIRNSKYTTGCLTTSDGEVGVPVSFADGCPSDLTSVFKVVTSRRLDTAGLNADEAFALTRANVGMFQLQEEVSGNDKCLELNSEEEPLTVVQPADCDGKLNQIFRFNEVTAGSWQIFTRSDPEQSTAAPMCLTVNNLLGQLNLATCVSGSATQLFTVEVEAGCLAVPGYDAIPSKTIVGSTLKQLSSKSFKTVADVAKACTANCSCLAFTSRGALKSTKAYPEAAGAFNECTYVAQSTKYCTCPAIPGFVATPRGDSAILREGDTRITGPVTVTELGLRCAADCSCISFNSAGVLRKGAKSKSPTSTSGPVDCFYVKDKAQQCNAEPCPRTLKCITTDMSAVPNPPLTSRIPSLSVPGWPSLMDVLQPSVLVGYLSKKTVGATDTSTLPGGPPPDNTCSAAALPIFPGSIIKSSPFLSLLSDGACANLTPVDASHYITGLISSKAKDFTATIPGADDFLSFKRSSEIGAAKKDGQDISVCIAMDPCLLDVHLGFKGVFADISLPLGPLPPVNVSSVEIKSLSYSQQADGEGIRRPALPWRYVASAPGVTGQTQWVVTGVDTVVRGNIWTKFTNSALSWEYVTGINEVASIYVTGDMEVVTWTSPLFTRFAVQTKSLPVLWLLDTFPIDLQMLTADFTTPMLFNVEHFTPKDFAVYFAADITTISEKALLDDVLNGPLGVLLKDMITFKDEIGVTIDAHLDPYGGGIRLVFKGPVTLAKPFAASDDVFALAVSPTFADGLEIRIKLTKVQGKFKAIGFATIEKKEISYATCKMPDDCPADQVCKMGVCSIAVVP